MPGESYEGIHYEVREDQGLHITDGDGHSISFSEIGAKSLRAYLNRNVRVML